MIELNPSSDWRVWLHGALLILPWLSIGLTYSSWFRAHLRAVVLMTGVSSLALAAGLFAAVDEAPVLTARSAASGLAQLTILGVDEVSSPLLPMASIIWLAGLVIAPAHTFTLARARRTTLSFACLVLAFSTKSLGLLAMMWIVSCGLFLLEHRHIRRVLRVAGAYLAASSLLFVAGAGLLWTQRPELLWPGSAALALAVLIRKGILPVHSWLPEAFEHGFLVPTIRFTTPQLGTYVAAVVLLPTAPEGVLTLVGVAAVVTTVYGALLGLAEPDARRAVGHLFLSQSALVLAGMDTTTQAGVGGSLTVWLSSALASAGLGLTLAALEARRGRLSLRGFHGGFERMPVLSGTFLVFGLATVGFPLTLGFFGHELLVTGSVERFPYLGFALIAASALNGITVVRMYFALFCGRRIAAVPLSLRRREVVALAALGLVLVVGGVFPRRFIESRSRAAKQLLDGTMRLTSAKLAPR